MLLPAGAEGTRPLDMEEDPEEELRLILIGKTGSGKSASGNTILGGSHFLSKFSSSSVTKVCRAGTSDYPVEEVRRSRRKRMVVVDTPGFGDTHLSREEIITEISRSVALTAPGPHAFLLVVPLGRYTEDQNAAVTQMVEVFGEVALSNHTVVLFTRGDELEEPVEQHLDSTPASLKALIDRCGGGYHVLNNRAPGEEEQVHQLLRKVEQVVADRGGCYTNTMYQQAEAAIREEEGRWRRGCGRADGEDEVVEERRGGALRERRERCTGGMQHRSSVGSSPGPPPPPSSSWRQWFREHLPPHVMQKIKVMVVAVLAGAVVGAAYGVAAPLVLGASKTYVALGGTLVGLVGGTLGAVVGAEADTPQEAVKETLQSLTPLGSLVMTLAEAVRKSNSGHKI